MSFICRLLPMCLMLLTINTVVKAQEGQTRLVASVKPITHLIQPLIEGVDGVSIETLNSTASVHEFNLTPGQASHIEIAHRVYWFGPRFEHGIGAALNNLGGERVLALNAAAYDKAHDKDAGTTEHDHEDDHGHEDEHGHEGEHGHEDEHDHDGEHHSAHPHLWLSGEGVLHLIEALAADLMTLLPQASPQIGRNKRQFLARYDSFVAETSAQLSALSKVRFVADHPTFEEFTQHFELPDMMFIQKSEEQTPSVKHIRAVQNYIEAEGVTCVAYTDTAKKESLKKAFPQLEPVYVDVLGLDSADYFQLMHSVIDALSTCSTKQIGYTRKIQGIISGL